METYNIGLDIGSTTAKMVVLDGGGNPVHHVYKRHRARVRETLAAFFAELKELLGNAPLRVRFTGSVGMGIAERLSLPFVQEVVAAANYLKHCHPDVTTLIDIGGEDAKLVFFADGRATDLRMNGNCAGGTGAFIDQMAILLNVSPAELGTLSEQSTRLYPIASRCGVFCKTDIQNLIARNVPREDIAASIFHAVAVQTVVTLAHGHTLRPPILLCGGPLTFIPALRKAFADYLQLPAQSFIVPERAHLLPASGAALGAQGETLRIDDLLQRTRGAAGEARKAEALPPLFENRPAYEAWKRRMQRDTLQRVALPAGPTEAFMGIDSGSTTTKIVVLNRKGEMLFTYYHDNEGNPVKTVEQGLRELAAQCAAAGSDLHIAGSCSTGYGEDLIKAAFRMDDGIVETMAHYMAAKHIDKDVSFILDIGGQDMKAIFVDNGVINRIEVNEACSSGCGSFISTFARSLNCSVGDFSAMACLAPAPCDLGTRCTVFMNSKVKQVLREGVSMADIAAGLSYSVVKNCLYKVLRLKDTAALGNHVVVQGGTMRNDSIVRSLERLTGKELLRGNAPELMGAVGCALYSMEAAANRQGAPGRTPDEIVGNAAYTSTLQHCRGCENHCAITRYRFKNANVYYSGNRCERIFSNKGTKGEPGVNAYEMKRALLFDRHAEPEKPLLTIGIPRCLNMYEEYPFWHTLFTACNIRVCLSEVSTLVRYEKSAAQVMSDNICFPAKLVHSHIDQLATRNDVDRIFMPFVVYEKGDRQTQNSYNCPIVTGYSQVIKSVQAQRHVPIDTPAVSFKDEKALYRQCRDYLSLLGVKESAIRAAFGRALAEQQRFEEELAAYNAQLAAEARQRGCLAILLAGRPYHTDALIQHKVSDMIAALGAYVLTDDVVRRQPQALPDVQYLSQWAFTNRILRAAQWVCEQDDGVQYMQLTSFGCGPDAFLTDEVQALLRRHGKSLTLLKIDDVNNIGSLKLRVRSHIESLHLRRGAPRHGAAPAPTSPPYTKEEAHKKIIVPFFTPFFSPLVPPLMKLAGYEVENLPMSDTASADWGLKYSNNEVCYPATLIVGDVVKAFREGRYDPENTCVAITQTGGQCRASNYLSLIRKALIENGYTHTPVVSVAFDSGIENNQPGFHINWRKLLPVTLAAILYSDSLAKFYYAAVVREQVPGAAARLRDRYLAAAEAPIRQHHTEALYALLDEAAAEIDAICRDEERPRVGIVGEIFLKYHPFAQKHVTEWLIDRQIEVVYPSLLDFFLQSFVNIKENKRTHLQKSHVPNFVIDLLHSLVYKQMNRVNLIGRKFRYFTPFENIFEKAALARPLISLAAQFGEGWLIAGEMAALAAQGVNHVVSLQPFGCIANHIIEKGIENRIKMFHPGLNILSLDFDSSVSEVNIANRLLLFIHDLIPVEA